MVQPGATDTRRRREMPIRGSRARPSKMRTSRLKITRALTIAIGAFVIAAASAAPASAAAEPSVETELQGLHLVDYFPSDAGWGEMWWHWNPQQLGNDFARVAALHANAVRIIVSAPAFGFPQPTATMEEHLESTLALAAAHGLRVELTLFNEWTDYGDIADSETWARQVLAPLSGDHEIVYIDLHDELPVSTNRDAPAWAEAMVPFVKSVDGGLPVTISTSISSGIGPLQALIGALASNPPDLYDIHYFGSAADAYAILAEARATVHGAPLFVGETGFATSPAYGWARGLLPTASSLESYQDYYYRTVESATAALSLPPAAPWILYDMPGQGGTLWGYHMGILRADGSPKPAAGVLASVFSGATPEASFNNGFEEGSSLPAIWRRWLPRDAHFAREHAITHSGSAAVSISHAGGTHLTGCPAFYAAPIAAITPGVDYDASVWALGSATAGSSRIVLVWTTSSGRFIASSPSPSLPAGNTGWTQLSVSAAPPAGAAAVEIDLQVCESPGTTYFDDVTFSPAALAASQRAAARPPGHALRGARARRRGRAARRR